MKIILRERASRALEEKGSELLARKVDKFHINIGFSSETNSWHYLRFSRIDEHRILMKFVSTNTDSLILAEDPSNTVLDITLNIEEFRKIVNKET